MKNCNKKEEIISTGSKLIIEKGYLNTSIQDITSKMGIAKGSFYTYFIVISAIFLPTTCIMHNKQQ